MPDDAPKKHSCPDCISCQWCSDERCTLCLRHVGCGRRKRSIAEQIALYDALNSSDSDTLKR